MKTKTSKLSLTKNTLRTTTSIKAGPAFMSRETFVVAPIAPLQQNPIANNG